MRIGSSRLTCCDKRHLSARQPHRRTRSTRPRAVPLLPNGRPLVGNVRCSWHRPDLVLPRYKLALFVHGCFWHQHPGCRLASKPKSRTDYWEPKLARNVARDAAAAAALEALGWRVETIWKCDTRNDERLSSRLDDVVSRLRVQSCGRRPRSGCTADVGTPSRDEPPT
jgi:G:T-mismatch repair DNA endonuclease (very short patch repair protein)